jgi:hypothetical protein
LAANDFRALFHIKVAENSGVPLTAGDLRQRMGVSGAAITYLVERRSHRVMCAANPIPPTGGR